MRTNEALALGRMTINRDPVAVLKELRAAISYIPRHGSVIVLGDHTSFLHRALDECIAYHTGGDTIMRKPDKV